MPQTGKLIGQVFAGRYRIEEQVGRGGMGFVFRAVHTTMNKVVALKVMSSQMAMDPENVERFEREAAAACELRHPNTIHMFDFGTSDQGELYLAMEFLKGRTLARCLQEDGPFSPLRARAILRQVMESLEEAHTKGIIHRDLKPENVFLTDINRSRDFVKVLDFGIAKFRDRDQIKQTLTRTGFVCGTPQYLAPEQGLGTHISPATDLYAAGVVLYELLTGAPPFFSDDPVSLVMKHIHETPPPLALEVRAILPKGFSELLWQLLQKEPGKRPVSAAEVVERLDALGTLSDESPPAPDFENAASDAAPTQVVRPTPGQFDESGTEVPTLSATPLSGTAVDPTTRTTAPPLMQERTPSRRRALVIGGLVLLGMAAAAVFLWEGLWSRLPAEEPPPPQAVVVSEPALAVVVPQEAEDIQVRPDVSVDLVEEPRTELRGDVTLEQVPTPEPLPETPAAPPVPPPPHTVHITSTPTGAAVLVDGEPLGTTPLGLLVDESKEPVTIRVTLEDHEPQSWVFVPESVYRRVGEKEFILTPSPEPAPEAAIEATPVKQSPRPPGSSPFGDLW